MCIPLSSLLFSYGRHSMNLSYDDNEMHNHKCQYGWKGLPKCQSFCFIGYGQDATLVIFHFCAKTIQYLKNPTSEKMLTEKWRWRRRRRHFTVEHIDAPVWALGFSRASIRMLPCEHQDASVRASGCSRVSMLMLLCEQRDAPILSSTCSYLSIRMLPCDHLDAPAWASLSVWTYFVFTQLCSTKSILMLPCEHIDAPMWASWCSRLSIMMLYFDAPVWASTCSPVVRVLMLTCEHRDANLRASWCSQATTATTAATTTATADSIWPRHCLYHV